MAAAAATAPAPAPAAKRPEEVGRPEQIKVVDALKLLGDDEAPQVDPSTGAPTSLRAYVVVLEPRMTVIPNFLSDAECDHLIELADGYWIPSLVGQATGVTEASYSIGDLENSVSQTRTSWSCMLRYAQTSVVERIEHRLAGVARMPLEQLERMNMVRYAPGERFNEHHDGKFRPRTVFVYLNDLPESEEEGDTFFPVLGLSFRPRRGAAVIWPNVAEGDDKEDGRMLHAGRPPTWGVKYGVNCFFNVKGMRQTMAMGSDFPVEKATVVHAADLGGHGPSPAPGAASASPTAYLLVRDPDLVCVPQVLTADEAEDIAQLYTAAAPEGEGSSLGLFADGTLTLRVLEARETPAVAAVEERLVTISGLPEEHLGRLRIVRPGARAGLCNRGCGPKSVYVCLSEGDEVFFVKLGLRIVLRRGDAVVCPNVEWDQTDSPVEDARTERVHLGGPGALGLDAFFHDNPVREQQRQRPFAAG